MPKKPSKMLVVNGRPPDYSDDLLNQIMEYLQGGKTLYEISKLEGMPTFRTLANWRHTRPEFFHILTAVEEDKTREMRRDMDNTTNVLKQAVAGLEGAAALLNYSAVKATVDSIEKVSKVQIVKGDPPPISDQSDDIEEQRRRFEQLHPMTQERIREALLEDQRLRGEGEDEE